MQPAMSLSHQQNINIFTTQMLVTFITSTSLVVVVRTLDSQLVGLIPGHDSAQLFEIGDRL